MLDYKKTVVSQYGNSPKLLQLIEDFNDVIDPAADIDAFYANFWDIDTAIGVGLDIWGRIIGIGRNITIQPVSTYLGFHEGQTSAVDYEPFGHGILYSGVRNGAFVLTDTAYRTLLFARALGNITDGSVPSYNRLLSLLFPTNTVYLKLTGTMTVQVYFATAPTAFETSVLVAAFPGITPSGVQFTT